MCTVCIPTWLRECELGSRYSSGSLKVSTVASRLLFFSIQVTSQAWRALSARKSMLTLWCWWWWSVSSAPIAPLVSSVSPSNQKLIYNWDSWWMHLTSWAWWWRTFFFFFLSFRIILKCKCSLSWAPRYKNHLGLLKEGKIMSDFLTVQQEHCAVAVVTLLLLLLLMCFDSMVSGRLGKACRVKAAKLEQGGGIWSKWSGSFNP